MKTAIVCTVLGLGVLTAGQMGHSSASVATSAETYEHLANAIISLRQAEDGLVQGILMHAEAAAQGALADAAGATGDARKTALESAASHVTDIANEGGKTVQAIKQRLVKAGHHHHTDAETKEDYLFINGKEKKDLLALAQSVSKMGADASPQDIHGVQDKLAAMFGKAIAPE